MDKPYVTHIILQGYHTTPLWYSEREAAIACDLSIGTLHSLRTIGLIKGEGTGKERRYNAEEVTRLRQIRRLQHDLGINLAGVEVILHLLKRLDDINQELEQERNRTTTSVPSNRLLLRD